MKLLVTIFLFTTAIFASEGFKKDVEYICLNTHMLSQGKKYESNTQEALKNPFIFTIKKDKLITVKNSVFDYKMQRGDMASYSNNNYMLLLIKNNELGLVPKKAKGSLQYFFECKTK